MPKSVTWTLDEDRETKGTFLFRDPDNRKHMLYVPKPDIKELGKKPEDAQLEVVLRWKKGE